VKWDGYRIVATIVDGDVRLWSRNGIESTQKVSLALQRARARGLALQADSHAVLDARLPLTSLDRRHRGTRRNSVSKE